MTRRALGACFLLLGLTAPAAIAQTPAADDAARQANLRAYVELLRADIRAEKVGIITSKSTVPGETRSPRQTSGVRFGSPALTTRGATEDQMRQIARAVARVAHDPEDAAVLDAVTAEMRAVADTLEQI